MTPTPFSSQSTRQPLRLTQFDTLVIVVIAALLVAIAVIISLGDRVGVQIVRSEPAGEAASTTSISLTFGEVMNWDSVIERLRFDPPLQGQYQPGGKTLRFTPDQPLAAGAQVNVTLLAGAQSSSGRAVLHDLSFNFSVRTPRVAYLTPADSVPQNVWIADPNNPQGAQQVTFSESSVMNFDISPDGTRIAYAERNVDGTADIKLLELKSGAVRKITNCVDSNCDTPVWRPDGNMIAYQRIDLNSDFQQVGVSPTRVWLIDLTANPPSERPLFTDNQILSYAPQWSADGGKIAVFDSNSRGILVYNMDDGSMTLIPSRSGSDMALSPDGTKVVFPRLIFEDGGGGARSILQIADLNEGEIDDLVDPEEPVDDVQTAWNPDGRRLALARRYTDERATRTRQLYLLDTETNQLNELIFDERYFNGFFSWNPEGSELLIQRFPELTDTGDFNQNGRPEVWTYRLADGRLEQVAQNAYLPHWIP
jgi:Tol biopolymer transport system component